MNVHLAVSSHAHRDPNEGEGWRQREGGMGSSERKRERAGVRMPNACIPHFIAG